MWRLLALPSRAIYNINKGERNTRTETRIAARIERSFPRSITFLSWNLSPGTTTARSAYSGRSGVHPAIDVPCIVVRIRRTPSSSLYPTEAIFVLVDFPARGLIFGDTSARAVDEAHGHLNTHFHRLANKISIALVAWIVHWQCIGTSRRL